MDSISKAIRKKLENELSRKKSGASRTRQSRTKQIPGTVSALKPLQALTVSERMLVIEAAQLMAAKRADCVLVVDEDDHLSGIFTVCKKRRWGQLLYSFFTLITPETRRGNDLIRILSVSVFLGKGFGLSSGCGIVRCQVM